jgi:hypothetical protein
MLGQQGDGRVSILKKDWVARETDLYDRRRFGFDIAFWSASKTGPTRKLRWS